ncbi:alpha/beta fold hydrolase [Gymnodinialimonas sp. 2305UL16-5]|uniref:alpha/beta fold hydrolase n=1 Tax=Gymnodinialimonas mytili TaxID=3126503 RepID=UPI00309F213A
MHEPLVLLPGMMCDARLFEPQITAFSAERAVMVAPLSGAERVQDLAAQILSDAPARFALAGLSMGGIVAMEILAQAPERVTRLALLDTNPLPDTPERAADRDRQIAEVQAGGLRAMMRDEMKPNYLADGPTTGAILDLCMAMAEALGPDVFIRQSRALQMRPDQTETLRSLSVPVLVLCGAEDTLCPVSRHEMMRDLIPGAELQVIAGAGHLPTLEQPAATHAALAHWLTGP